MNILELQDSLKNLPDNALMQEMQMPTGTAPQFLVLSELKRRKRMRDEFQRQQNSNMPTVAEETVAAAGMPQGGIMDAARAMAPKTNVAQNTGMDTAVPVQATRAPQPQMMADGGYVQRMQVGGMTGGAATAIAMLRENYPDLYEQYKDSPYLGQVAAAAMGESARTPEMTGLEELEAPRDYDLLQSLFTDPSNRAATKAQSEIAATQAERELAGQIDTQQTLRDRADDAGLFAEGSVTEYLRGTPEGGFPRRSDAMDTAPSLVSPDVESFIPPTMPQMDMGVRSSSGFASSPEAPAMGEGFTAPETDFSYASGSPAETAAIRRYLAGEDQGLGIPEEVERRAAEFYGSDTYTPPEEIYDLGPYGRTKYETEDPAERDRLFSEASRRMFEERQAADAAAEQRAINLDEELQTRQRAAERIGDKIASDQPSPPVGFVEGIASDIASGLGSFNREQTALAAARAADETAVGEMGDIVPFGETELGRQKAAEEAAAQDMAEISGATKTTSGGAGGAGFGSLDSRIATMLSERQKQAESDKWMALAMAGMELMKPTATIGEGLGKAGQAGLGYLTATRQKQQDFETDMLKLQSQLDIARARASGSGRSGALTLNQYLSRGEDLITAGQKMLENAGDNADAASRGQDLIDRGMALISIATGGGGGQTSGGAKTVNIS